MKSRLLNILLWLLALVLLGGLVFGYFALQGQSRYAIKPNLTRVNVAGMDEEVFLNKEDVMQVLPVSIQDTVTQPISLKEVESVLKKKIPYAKSVNAYISPTSHQMTVQVDSRRPILRYFTRDGAYYLDDEGNPMHTKSGVSIYVPVIKAGAVDTLTIKKTLYPLAKFLDNNKSWSTFFSLIEIKEGNRLHFYPRIGDYIFEVIGTTNLKEDLSKIKIFYTKIVPQVGSNRYELIKLSYANQIVCKRKAENTAAIN